MTEQVVPAPHGYLTSSQPNQLLIRFHVRFALPITSHRSTACSTGRSERARAGLRLTPVDGIASISIALRQILSSPKTISEACAARGLAMKPASLPGASHEPPLAAAALAVRA